MARIAPSEMKDGDTLEPWHLNYIFSFIRRWQKFDASPPLNLDNSGESPPHLSLFNEDAVVPVTFTSGIAAGSISSPTNATVDLLIEYQGGPALTASGNTANCYNTSTIAITSGVSGWAVWRGPYLYALDWDC